MYIGIWEMLFCLLWIIIYVYVLQCTIDSIQKGLQFRSTNLIEMVVYHNELPYYIVRWDMGRNAFCLSDIHIRNSKWLRWRSKYWIQLWEMWEMSLDPIWLMGKLYVYWTDHALLFRHCWLWGNTSRAPFVWSRHTFPIFIHLSMEPIVLAGCRFITIFYSCAGVWLAVL